MIILLLEHLAVMLKAQLRLLNLSKSNRLKIK
jgi:hypothetical protein